MGFHSTTAELQYLHKNGCWFIEWVDTTCSATVFHLVAPLKLPWDEGKIQLIAAMPGHHTVLPLSAVHSLMGIAVGAVQGLSCVFLSAGWGLSQTHCKFKKDLLKLLFQTVRLGCGALQTDNHSILKQGPTCYPPSLPLSHYFLLLSRQKVCPERTHRNTHAS